jgi:hypothetical protein
LNEIAPPRQLRRWAALNRAIERSNEMPNGRPGDNPLTDLTIHGAHPFPQDIEEMLLTVDTLGRRPGRWPLGENWPFSPKEFDWEQGKNLEEARRLLTHLIAMLESGRGDEVLLNPLSGKPFADG